MKTNVFFNDLHTKEHDDYIMQSILHSSNLQLVRSWYSGNRHEHNFKSSLHDCKCQTKWIYTHEQHCAYYRSQISNPKKCYEEESHVLHISLYTCKKTITSKTVLFPVNESFWKFGMRSYGFLLSLMCIYRIHFLCTFL